MKNKIVAIHQPNFIPWIGYFNKIAQSDIFVLIDDVQFEKGSVCNRNKIKSNIGEEVLLTVPVKLSKGSRQTFREIEIAYDQKWQRKTLNYLKVYYQKAKYFDNYFADLTSIFNPRYNNLAELNIALIKYICVKLEIKTKIFTQTNLKKDFEKKNYLNMNICKYFNVNIYLSGQGAKKYNDEKLFNDNGIEIVYQKFNHPIYPQLWGDFIPNLSIIDLLFNCGPESKYFFEGK